MKPPPESGVTEELLRRRHHLPHWQQGGSTYFITFRSARGILPVAARTLARDLILENHGSRCDLAFGVVMPDHVHLLLRPREREPGFWWDLATILRGIKGASARRINQLLEMQGTVWQKERFDRIVRDEGEFEEKWRYIYFNPYKAGLVDDPEAYPYFIRPPQDG